MSNHSMRDLASQVAYLERTTEFAKAQLQAVGRLANERVELDTYADNAVERATTRYGVGMREHLELAIRYGEEWFDAVNSELSRSTARS
ncbi:hypothetical protein [Kribbella monticola]|uniref:hypothetical protein n=1 Tax=Kribbella monticola TaxID=2185285 RepID=UPI000DD3295C|nr:hypothetical protein [Kribbella monticola]